jgi:hypothetical protein
MAKEECSRKAGARDQTGQRAHIFRGESLYEWDVWTASHIHPFSLQTAKLGSLVEVQDSDDPEGLRVFYYLVQDLKVSLSH